jgi:hypothetical protein
METEILIFESEDGRYCLNLVGTDDRTYELFKELERQGGGYTWEGIVTSLSELNTPNVLHKVDIGAEADNMYIYTAHRKTLEDIASLVRDACSDHSLLQKAIDHAGDDLE